MYTYLPYLTLPYLTLPCLALPCLALPYLTLPYLTFPHLTLPYLTLPYLPNLTCRRLSYVRTLVSQSSGATRRLHLTHTHTHTHTHTRNQGHTASVAHACDPNALQKHSRPALNKPQMNPTAQICHVKASEPNQRQFRSRPYFCKFDV